MQYLLDSITGPRAFGFRSDGVYFQFGVWPHSGGEYALENKQSGVVYLFRHEEESLVQHAHKKYATSPPQHAPRSIPSDVQEKLDSRLDVNVVNK